MGRKRIRLYNLHNLLDIRTLVLYISLSGMHGSLVAPADFKSVVRRFRLGWVRFPHIPAFFPAPQKAGTVVKALHSPERFLSEPRHQAGPAARSALFRPWRGEDKNQQKRSPVRRGISRLMFLSVAGSNCSSVAVLLYKTLIPLAARPSANPLHFCRLFLIVV